MKATARLVLGGMILGMLAATEASALDGWLPSREAGLEAAKKSGKPVLVVTLWKERV